jgi:hypothetical protein
MTCFNNAKSRVVYYQSALLSFNGCLRGFCLFFFWRLDRPSMQLGSGMRMPMCCDWLGCFIIGASFVSLQVQLALAIGTSYLTASPSHPHRSAFPVPRHKV